MGSSRDDPKLDGDLDDDPERGPTPEERPNGASTELMLGSFRVDQPEQNVRVEDTVLIRTCSLAAAL